MGFLHERGTQHNGTTEGFYSKGTYWALIAGGILLGYNTYFCSVSLCDCLFGVYRALWAAVMFCIPWKTA